MQTINTCDNCVLLDQRSKKNNSKNGKSKMKIQHTNCKSNSFQCLDLLAFQHNLCTNALHSFISIHIFSANKKIIYFFLEKHF